MSDWQPISTAPKDTKTMFVVRGFNVPMPNNRNYTTDPYCVWRENDGGFARWPFKFPPTHWFALPEPPK